MKDGLEVTPAAGEVASPQDPLFHPLSPKEKWSCPAAPCRALWDTIVVAAAVAGGVDQTIELCKGGWMVLEWNRPSGGGSSGREPLAPE